MIKINKSVRWTVALFGLTLLASCGYERQAGQDERDVHAELYGANAASDAILDRSTLTVVRMAFRLGDRYKSLGDSAAAQRDQLTAGLIVVAGGAALAEASGVGTREIAGAAILGLGLNEGAKYVNLTGAAEAFYAASEEMNCVATTSVETIGTGVDSANPAASSVVFRFVRRVELRLRTKLQRDVPDYTDIVGAVRPSGETPLGFEFGGAGIDLQALRTALAECLPEEEDATGS